MLLLLLLFCLSLQCPPFWLWEDDLSYYYPGCHDWMESPVLEIGFGPPSADFRSIWSSQKERTLYLDPQSLNHNKLLLPYCVLFNKQNLRAYLLAFILSNKLLLLLYFLALPNVFGPPSTLPALVNFKDRGHPWALRFFFIRYGFNTIFGFFLGTIQYWYNILASEMTFFLGIYCMTTFFLGEFFDDLFFCIFLTNCS